MEKENITDILEGKENYQGEAHYKGYRYEPVKYIMDMKFDFIQGNIIKYLVRYRKKNGLQDLKKAKNYAEIASKDKGIHEKIFRSTLDQNPNFPNTISFVIQEQFDQQTQDFLMIAVTLICNYQMKELAHLIDMQMKIEYPTNEQE